MAVSAGMIKELRVKTGAGILDCKKALTQNDGDMNAAIEFLRKKGLASAAKKSGRVAAEGTIFSYIHGEGRIGVLLEVNCETDFVARTDGFTGLCKDICMQIAAYSPGWLRREDVPAELLDKERDILAAQAREGGKPEKVIERIVTGRIDKFYGENCLMEQKFIKDPDKTVQQVVTERIATIGENINVRRFTRYVLGEGLQKKEENFAEEVAKQIQG